MGGTKTEIQAAPVTPAPAPSETARAQWEAQLEFQPQLFEEWMKSYQQYAPQIAGVDIGVQQEFAPQMRALQQEMFPQQTQLVEAMAGRALERLEDPFGYTPEEQEALGGIRGRQREELTRGIRTRAELGGGLFGGRAAGREERALTELEQAFAGQDINRRLMGGQLAQQAAIPIAQILYPQMQQPQVPQFWQQPVPSGGQVYQAEAAAAQPQYFASQQQPSPLWGLGGSLAGGLGAGWGMGMFNN